MEAETAETSPGFTTERHEALRTIGQFLDFVDLCRCGRLADLVVQIRDALELHEAPPFDERANRVDFDNPAHIALAYMLDAWKLTEHGSSIVGAWLTSDGVRLRNALRLVGVDGDALDELDYPGDWWIREHELHPQGRDGSGCVSLGDWHPEETTHPAGGSLVSHGAAQVPGHIVEQVMAVMARPRHAGSARWPDAAMVRANASRLASAWWHEAFVAGANYATQLAALPRYIITPSGPMQDSRLHELLPLPDGFGAHMLPIPARCQVCGTQPSTATVRFDTGEDGGAPTGLILEPCRHVVDIPR